MSSLRLTADARREQILDVAIDVFGKAGYYRASMNEIAEAAGVTKPVLYQHFDSKSELYSALLEEVGSRLLLAIGAATAAARNGREQTEFGFRAYFRWVAGRHDEFMLLFGGGTRHDSTFGATVKRITATAAAAIDPLIAVDVDPETRRTLAHALVGLAEGAGRQLVERGEDFDPDATAQAISSLAWAGLRAIAPAEPKA